MNMQRLPLDTVNAAGRLRPVDPAHVLLIMATASQEGIRTPIEVRPAKDKGQYLLVTGAHRFAAATELGHADIPAIVLPKMSDDEARLVEINENVYRHELSDLDRAVFLAEKKRIHEKLNPQTRHGGDRRSGVSSDQVAIFGDLIDRFTVEVQEQLGYSERTIQRIVRRATIAPEVRASLAGTSFARNGAELDALVKLKEPALQMSAVRMVLSGDPAAPKSIVAAAAKISGRYSAPQNDVQEIQYGALRKDWKNAGAGARDRFLRQLRADGDERLERLLSELVDELVADGVLSRFEKAA